MWVLSHEDSFWLRGKSQLGKEQDTYLSKGHSLQAGVQIAARELLRQPEKILHLQ